MKDRDVRPQRVAVLGLGYVGCVSAACLAKLGHSVVGVDKDEFKVRAVADGAAPFYEPGLEELLKDGVQSARLSATTDTVAALAGADIALICVGTPSDESGNLDMTFLRRVTAEIVPTLDQRQVPLLVTVRSTVFPGINEQLYNEVFGCHPMVRMVSNPEFMREGAAVRDFMEPALLVVGSDDEAAARQVAKLYSVLATEACIVSIRTAEMIKYACNAYHAVKVAFANEIGSYCTRMGIPADEVMDTFCRDEKLNISKAYLRPGFAFGGSCLPKDLRAINFRARNAGIDLPLLASVLPSNDQQLKRLVDRALELPGQRLGIFGLAFKENTDDLRESPVVHFIEQLIGKGRNLRIFDPHIDLTKIYGSNQRYLFRAIPHIGNLMQTSLDDVLGWADNIVVAQSPSAEMRDRLTACGKPLLFLA